MRRTKFAVLALLVSGLVTMASCGKDHKASVLPNPSPTPTPPPGPISLRKVPVASGLDIPVFLTAPANDDRLFIVEKTGKIRIVKNGSLLTTPFLDVTNLLGGVLDYEQGLLGLAFSPSYSSDGRFYISYTDGGNDVHVARYHVSSGDPDVANPTAEAILITVDHSSEKNHNGGMLAWGPGGLYFSVGDGGGGYDPNNNGQDKTDRLGDILRLDANGAAALGNPFSAPDNPEVWCYGLRNPWRFSFDRQTNDLYIGDVGQALHEEIDVALASQGGGRGLNFGWKIREGFSCLGDDPCQSAGLTPPAIDYPHDANACAVIGGFVYRGNAIPALQGTYLYGDNCAGWIRSFKYVGGQATGAATWPDLATDGLTSFGQDAAGELYLMNGDGDVFRIASN